jgi:predicted phage terminase large subunit-like protein
MPVISTAEYAAFSRHDLYSFMHRAFRELNPSVPFLHNWHNELVAAKLAACLRGEITRLIINMPPRSLKSHAAAVAFPAFLMGHNPSAQIICASYGEELAHKHSLDCRNLMSSQWYMNLFRTRLSPQKLSLQEFMTTENGFRMATSVGGMLTGRGADYIIIDDPLKPDEALSATQRKGANDWFDHTLYSRLNDKRRGCIIVIMQRLHQDDLVGHVLELEKWDLVRLPAIAEEDETHIIKAPYRTRIVRRKAGEALHREREPLAVLEHVRRTIGAYNFAGQYQQQPAPLGGGMVKAEWFKTYVPGEQPSKFDLIFQSWDTANKSTELSDFSACTTWGSKDKRLYLLHVYRERLEFPDLKRAIVQLAAHHGASTILVEDKASGTQLIQDLSREGVYGLTRYEPKMDKIMRLHSVTSTIENGFVYLPQQAEWLGEYLHELTTFPNGKYDDQADSTSQALDWIKGGMLCLGVVEYFRQEAAKIGLDLDGSPLASKTHVQPCVAVHEKTGQKIRWDEGGQRWVNFETGEPYAN